MCSKLLQLPSLLSILWRCSGVAFGAFLLLLPQAVANDTSSTLAAGGLVLTKNEQVEMRSEDLFISPSLVEVKYVFVNNSATDIATIVAFPMPEVEYTESPVSVPSDDPVNFMDFSVVVDDAPVTAELESKALLEGKDITARLDALKIPLNPTADTILSILDALPEADRKALVTEKITFETEYDSGNGMETHLLPAWTLKSIYHWPQTFPAGKEVRVLHRYKPSVGGSAGSALKPYDGSKVDDEALAEYKSRNCTDDVFLAAVKKIDARKFYVIERWIDYILVTGGNWAGGTIGDFRLVIDKGTPKALVSFCADDVKKISSTQFEVRKRNFKPERDLNILILEPLAYDEVPN